MLPSRGDLAGRLAPVLLALWPVLFVAGNNPGEFSAVELAVVVSCAGLVGVAFGVLGKAVVRGRHASRLAGMILVAMLYAPFIVASLARNQALRAVPAISTLLHVLLAALAGLALLRLRRAGQGSEGTVRALGIGVAALFAMAAFPAIRSSALSHPAPRALEPRGAKDDSLPDIYLIVLDQYASNSVLAWRFGFSNQAFTDSLRIRGFELPAASWSNYAYTAASVASMLNMTHVTSVADSVGPDERSLVPLNRMIVDNVAFRLVRSAGYRVVFVRSPAFHGTRTAPAADRVVQTSSGLQWLGVQATSPLAIEALRLTWIGRALESLNVRLGSPWRELAPYRGIEAAIGEPGPKFVFAHAMTTHQPFYFTPECRWAPRAKPVYDRLYVAQVQCANRQLLRVIDQILVSGRPSIVLLQADHGTASLGSRSLPRAADLSQAQAAERFGAFAAYRLPEGGALADTVTPVNLLRMAFNRYLGSQLPLLPDSAYHSIVERDYELIPVDLEAVAKTDGHSAVAGSGVATSPHGRAGID